MKTFKDILKQANNVSCRNFTEEEKEYANSLFGDIVNYATNFEIEYGCGVNLFAIVKDIELHKLAKQHNIELPENWKNYPVLTSALALTDSYNLALCDGYNGTAKELKLARDEFYAEYNLDVTNFKGVSLKEQELDLSL